MLWKVEHGDGEKDERAEKQHARLRQGNRQNRRLRISIGLGPLAPSIWARPTQISSSSTLERLFLPASPYFLLPPSYTI